MARISGVDLPREKRVEIGLTYIYGIGLTSSKDILAKTGINPDTRVKDPYVFLRLSLFSDLLREDPCGVLLLCKHRFPQDA